VIEPGAGEIVKLVEIKILKEEVMVVDEVADRFGSRAVRIANLSTSVLHLTRTFHSWSC
jgi:hypothetical protein